MDKWGTLRYYFPFPFLMLDSYIELFQVHFIGIQQLLNELGKQSKVWSQLHNNSKHLDSASQSRAASALTLGGPMGVGNAAHQILGENPAPHGLLGNGLEEGERPTLIENRPNLEAVTERGTEVTGISKGHEGEVQQQPPVKDEW